MRLVNGTLKRRHQAREAYTDAFGQPLLFDLFEHGPRGGRIAVDEARGVLYSRFVSETPSEA